MKAVVTSLGAASLLFQIAAAQQEYKIDPNNVPIATRSNWCTSQTTQCPLICLQTPGVYGANVNECNATLLTYSCICSNGIVPNTSEYSLTLPYYICTEWGQECVANCGSNNNCAADCRDKHPCGAQSPKRVNLTTSTASSAASKTGDATTISVAATNKAAATDLAGNTITGAAGRLKPFVLEAGQTFGLVTLAGGLFAGFAILL